MPKPRRTEASRPAKKKPAPAKTKVQAKVAKAPKPARVAKKPVVTKKAAPAKKVVKPAKPAPKAVRPKPAKASAGGSKVVARPAAKAPAKPAPVATGPSPHESAVETFERGFQALQQRQFARAAELLSSVVKNFPDEKEMQERARVYLSICARLGGSASHQPRSYEERMNAATVAINRGAPDEGLALLKKLESDNGQNDHVHYMLCVVHTMRGDLGAALKHLQRAVELNAENRFRACQDADLDVLRGDAGFGQALEAAAAARPKPAAHPAPAARKR